MLTPNSTHFLVLLLFAGCTGPELQETTSHLDGTPEGVGVLRFLNDSSTTFSVLDDDVQLDRRAAKNIMDWRNGPDQSEGTGDDRVFKSLEEVDAVKWVGPKAMDKLIDFAHGNGFVPSGNDYLGTYDGIDFTVNEAEWVVNLVNDEEDEKLDELLDRRAVNVIIETRPLGSVLQVSEVPYLGRVGMNKLLDTAKSLQGRPVGDQCSSMEDCASGVCGGLTYWQTGFCLHSWAQGTYENQTAYAISDNSSVQSTIVINDQATVPMDVIVTLDIVHPRKEDLVVTLSQPGGGFEVLWDHEVNPPGTLLAGWGIERDNMVNGTWVLEVHDTVTGEVGTLHSWSMWVTSNYD